MNTDHIFSNRRKFILNTGKGIIAAGLAPIILKAQQTHPGSTGPMGLNGTDTIPVKLKPLDDLSEKQQGDVPAPLEPSARIGFAIVGLGHLSLENILPAFGKSKFARPVALVSGDAAKAATVARSYGIASSAIYNYDNFDEIAKNKDIQAVYIVLPNSMHAEFTIRAAKAGKHVLCEKPMAVSSAEAQSMIDACKAASTKLMIAYRIQYEPHHHFIRELVQTNKYGKTRVMEMFNGQNIGDPSQWRLKKALSGGGSLPDIGLYCLNTSRYLLGEEPDWVLANSYSTPGDPRFKEVEETVFFQLRFPGGTMVNCSTSYGVHQSRRYRCLADKGGWFGMDPAFSYTGLRAELSEIKENEDWHKVPMIEEKDQFALELDHMAQCIMHNKTPYTPGEEGLQDHRIMEAIYKSAKDGAPVSLKGSKEKDIFRGNMPDYK